MPPPSLAVDSAFQDFDPLSALNHISKEADWIGIRFACETHIIALQGMGTWNQTRSSKPEAS